MYLKELQIEGFKSFGTSATLSFPTTITGIVGPNGSGKSNVAEAFRFVLGEQSMKSMRGKRGEDLIFNGGTGTGRTSRAKVSIVFDNTDSMLNSAFNEVSLSRAVYRNGTNEYMINGTQVRHRDIVELLAKANIGSTGHHIISQGEADRILHASDEERAEMLEDGLGLKLLQYRRAETEKKLKRARTNITETDLLLREITPHLRHLKRQVERYEKAKKTREELVMLYAEYLAYETAYIAAAKCSTEGLFDTLTEQHGALEKEVAQEKKKIAPKQATEHSTKQEERAQEKLRAIRDKKDIASRDIGRLEGEQAALETLTQDTKTTTIPRRKLAHLYAEARKRYMAEAEEKYGVIITFMLEQIKELLGQRGANQSTAEKRFVDLQNKQGRVREHIAALQKEEQKCLCEQEELRKKKEQEFATTRESEKNLLALMTKKSKTEQELSGVRHALSVVREDEEHLRQEITEGTALIGAAIMKYKSVIIPHEIETEDRAKQKERRKALERKKIEP